MQPYLSPMFQPLLADRAVIRLSPQGDGESIRDFLQGLVTQDMAAQLPLWTALLTPQGKCLFDFIVYPAGEDLLIDCEATAADDLIRRLLLYRLRRRIAIGRDASLGVYWDTGFIDGPNADPRLPALGQRWIAERYGAAEEQDVSGAWRSHRLALGVTEGRAELADVLWLECNSAELHGVSFTKGCYVGQENTARMNWRSTVNRRLCVVPLTAADAKRQRAAYTELGWSVEHRRVEDIPDQAWRDWMGER
jgi:folate-binding protein YgfZ